MLKATGIISHLLKKTNKANHIDSAWTHHNQIFE
ncbi:hypothetical protein C8E01_1052 [Pontibacter virosus]|uniref:Uncharacterized protein n=1 Tax=Pontibacter virosus TaxID=1765052 RepID=A0A2U1AXU7_9BACT|nr:hypothetical protein C8E01_1052 [Pontibacter virosus]